MILYHHAYGCEVDSVALRGRLVDIAAEHAILRTAYECQSDGSVHQRVQPELSVGWWGEEHGHDDSHALELALWIAERPLVPMQGEVLQVTLIHVSSDRHLLVLAVHHIVFDGMSWALLLHHLAHPTVALSPIRSYQYLDFVAWQQMLRDSALFETQTEYWRRQLAGGRARGGLWHSRALRGARAPRDRA